MLRLLAIIFLPINFRQYELFDPRIYASNTTMRSLGDLLINSVFSVDSVVHVIICR
jgi:hypothetical protein